MNHIIRFVRSKINPNSETSIEPITNSDSSDNSSQEQTTYNDNSSDQSSQDTNHLVVLDTSSIPDTSFQLLMFHHI